MSNKLIITVLALFSIQISMAQSTFKGKVLDKKSKTALEKATVYFVELNKSVFTNDKGQFEAVVPDNKPLTLQISFLGYQTLIQSTPAVTSTEQEFLLNSGTFEVEEVIVSGAYNIMQNESPQEIDVIKPNSIENTDAPNLVEALSKIPGVTEISKGQLLSRPVIRGLSGNRVLTVSDGIRLENQQWDAEHAFGQTDLGLEKVEVIKGPATILYGPEAMGGVIHMIEEQPAPLDKVLGDVSLTGHSNGLGFIGNAGVKGSTSKYNWKIRGGGRTFSDYYSGLNERVANSRFGEGNLKASVGTTGNWGNTSLHYHFQQAFYGIVEPFEAAKEEEEEFPREAEAPYHMVTYNRVSSHSTFLVGKSKVKAVLGFQNDSRGEYEPDTLDPKNKLGVTYLDMNLQSTTYDLKWYSSETGNWSNILGVQGMMQKNKNAVETRLVPDASLMDFAALGMTRFHYKDFGVSAGVRYDMRDIDAKAFSGTSAGTYSTPKFEKSFSNLSESIGITYDIEEHLLIRANASTGYRSPNMVELLSNGIKLETQRFESGDVNFSAEKNLELDFSLRLQNSFATIEAAVYRNNFQDYIYLNPTGTLMLGKPLFSYKQADAILQGGEAGIDIHPSSWKGIHIESKGSMVRGFLNSGTQKSEDLPFMPADRINTSIGGEVGNWKKLQKVYVKVGALVVMNQNKVSPQETTTGGYTLYNLILGSTVNYKKYPLQISLAVNNLTNKTYIDHLSLLKPYGTPYMGINVALNVKVPLVFK